jgi:hypothetical protein
VARLLVVLGTLLVVVPARAAEPEVPLTDLSVRAIPAVFAGEGVGASLEGLATFRYSYGQGGVFVERGGALFAYGFTTYGVLLGPVLRTESGGRLSASGEFGVHDYDGFGGRLDGPGGADASVVFIGGRLMASYRLGGGFELGLATRLKGDFERDVPRKEPVGSHQTVGGYTLAVGLTFGVTNDL